MLIVYKKVDAHLYMGKLHTNTHSPLDIHTHSHTRERETDNRKHLRVLSFSRIKIGKYYRYACARAHSLSITHTCCNHTHAAITHMLQSHTREQHTHDTRIHTHICTNTPQRICAYLHKQHTQTHTPSQPTHTLSLSHTHKP